MKSIYEYKFDFEKCPYVSKAIDDVISRIVLEIFRFQIKYIIIHEEMGKRLFQEISRKIPGEIPSLMPSVRNSVYKGIRLLKTTDIEEDELKIIVKIKV